MKKNYDFSKGRRGAVVPAPGNKERITIRIDKEIVDWFRSVVRKKGGGSYQAMMNDALRFYIENKERPLEDILRKIVREELKKAS